MLEVDKSLTFWNLESLRQGTQRVRTAAQNLRQFLPQRCAHRRIGGGWFVSHRAVLLIPAFLWFSYACNGMSKDYPDPEEVRLQARDGLIAELRQEGIRDARVLEVISKVPREEFVLEGDRHRAYENRALAIERGQTISQPLIVAMMTELLELKGEEKVLEIGTGSGYQAAVLSLLAKEVFSIEIDPVLATQARERLHRLGYRNVHVRQGDGFYGWPEEAPFDGIIVTAVAPRIPEPLVDQLRAGGALVLPLEEGWNETLVRARKREDGSLQIERFGSVAFVPMRGAIRTPKEQQR